MKFHSLLFAPVLALSSSVSAFAPPPGLAPRRSSKISSSMAARTFQFVDYGSTYDTEDGRPTISCDGRIPGGVTLELTHWTGNETPDEYYADTSTEMALGLPTDVLPNAVVLNNHYDSDGVLSVFACLHPEQAQQYASLLKEGAEAGDFGEWSSDLGVKLDATLCAMCSNDEEASYHAVLRELPDILEDLSSTGGAKYKDLWGPTLDRANRGWESLQDGTVTMETIQSSEEGEEPCCMVIVRESPSSSLSSFALHRGLVEMGLIDTVTRVLRVTESPTTGFRYVLEKPGHGWVQRLVDRPCIPSVNAQKLVEQLNARDGWANKWKVGGPSGLVGIIYANQLQETPQEVARCLIEQENSMLELTR